MTPGTDVNNTIWRAVGSMMRRGFPMEEVIGEMIQRALDVAPAAEWTPEEQRIELESMCMRTVLNNPELEHLPTDKRRQQLDGLRKEGYKNFEVSRNRYGAYFRPGKGTKDAADDETTAQTDGIPVLSGSEFVKDFVPPDYLLDGILQTGFLYSFTARTGDGKTTSALLLAFCVAGNAFFAGLDCESGAVFFLAGENPDDVRIRWIGLRHAMGATIKELDIHFIPGVYRFPDIRAAIEKKVSEIGREPKLVIIDTSAAFFSGNEENSNTQLGGHAREMRKYFISLPGRPCVLVTTHPPKTPDMDNLVPRGGGAFLAEVDGNLTAIKNGELVTIHWAGKFRGPDFDPITLAIETVNAPELVDKKGRQIPTVIARPVEDHEEKILTDQRGENEATIRALGGGPILSRSKLAELCGWVRDGHPDDNRARVVTWRLQKKELIQYENGEWSLSAKGEAALDQLTGVKPKRRRSGF
jgi:hypothetical protein